MGQALKEMAGEQLSPPLGQMPQAGRHQRSADKDNHGIKNQCQKRSHSPHNKTFFPLGNWQLFPADGFLFAPGAGLC